MIGSMGIFLLGPPMVDGDGRLAPRDRIVLAVLAVRRGQVVMPDQLADAVWGDHPPPSWPTQVQICVGRLRKAMGAAAIDTTSGGYRLTLGGDEVDLDRFERLVAKGRASAAAGDPERAVTAFSKALGLWRGRPFIELDGWEPARHEAARLEELHRNVEEEVLAARLATGEHREVAAAAEPLVAAEPLRERRWAILALAQYRCGRQADALRSVARARRLLVDEVGIDPGSELVALEAAILRQDDSLVAPDIPAATGECPYKGLAAYDVDDAEVFFGRESEVAACLDRLRSTPLLVVAGPSGCGKSSLVRAGLVPALARGGRTSVVIVPGDDADGAMSEALGAANERPVLVVDEFEALFNAKSDPDITRAFCRRISRYAEEQATVVICVRADYLTGLSMDTDFARLAERGLYLVSPLTGDCLREAIEQPALRAGYRLEHGLVDLLVRDTEGEPGALPLLSHALVETWRRRDGRTLLVEGYRDSGGIRGAVARSADRLYDNLPTDQRAMLRSILLRLVTPSIDGDPVRCRVPTGTLIGDHQRERIVALLVRARLVTADADTVQLAHEALARAWPRLQTWLDEDATGVRVLRHLATAAAGWDTLGRPESELYRGARLDTALEWRGSARPDLTDVETAFLDASVAHTETERGALEARARRDARQNRRLRGALVGAALLAVCSLAAGAVAVQQQRQAQASAAEAEANAAEADAQRQRAEANVAEAQANAVEATAAGRLAEARRLGTQALVVDDYDQALLLAIEGRHMEDSVETRSNLLAAIERSPAASAVIRTGSEAFLDLAFTADGTALVASERGVRATMSRFDVATRRRTGSLPGPGPVLTSAVSPDGRRAVMSSFTGGFGDRTFELKVVDMDTFEVIGAPLPGLYNAPLARLTFSPDGRHVAAVTDSDLSGAGSFEPLALVWDVATGGGPVVQFPFSAPNFQRDVAFLRDSQRILVAGTDGTAIVDVTSGAQVGQIDGAHPPIAVSPDGRTLAAATDVNQGVTIGLFDLASGERSAALAGHRQRLVRLAFSPDGTTLASGGDDRLVIAWDLASGQPRAVYEGHAAGVNALAFGPDGNTLWSGGDDRAILVWDLQRAGTLVHRPSPLGAGLSELAYVATDMVTDPEGRYVVFPSADDLHFQIRDVATGALSEPTSVEDGEFMSFSPDLSRYLTVNQDLHLRLWDRATGARLADSEGSGLLFTGFHTDAAVFTPDGRSVVALALDEAAGSEQLVVLDAATLAPVGEAIPVGHTGRMVAVTPDGREAVVVVSNTEVPDTNVVLVDLDERRVVRSTPVAPGGTPVGGARNNTVASDGRTVGVGTTFGDVVFVDAETGDVSPLLHAHDDRVESITFAPDYATFVTTGRDGEVKLWDRASRRLLGSVRLSAQNLRLRASFLAADRLLIFDDTGQIYEWDPRPDAWEEHACTVAGRNLTVAEWGELFPGQAYRTTCAGFPAGE
jgi:WD40 repeat protein/DNA-binding SARP family transcriptional activator